jgi:nicotinate-nucleotide pyrophosphorylase (carboxylating)
MALLNQKQDIAFPYPAAERVIAAALAEDAAADDVTTRWSVPEGLMARAEVVTREPGIAAGLPAVAAVFGRVDERVEVEELVTDGARLRPGGALLRLHGPARSLITAERTVLNLLQRLCGIATLTDRYVRAVEGLPVRVFDTRKTAPGLRALDKYAVTAGGGHSYRLNLAAMVLLKENHIAAAGGVGTAIAAVRRGMAQDCRDVLINVEVQTVAQAREALDARVPWILLDNMPLPEMARVVHLREALTPGVDVVLEASGTITVDKVRAVAATGVDVISVGALTHSAPAVDLSMLLTAT